jgi:hypothetical protein
MRTVSQPNTSFAESSASQGFDPVGRWGKHLSPAELEKLEVLIGGTLQALGYPLAGGQRRGGGFRLWLLRKYYRSYFSLRLWAKSCQVPLVKHFIRDRQ